MARHVVARHVTRRRGSPFGSLARGVELAGAPLAIEDRDVLEYLNLADESLREWADRAHSSPA